MVMGGKRWKLKFAYIAACAANSPAEAWRSRASIMEEGKDNNINIIGKGKAERLSASLNSRQ